MQRFLTEAPWDAEAVRAKLPTYLAERLTAPDAVVVLAETGFPKPGTQSVGVARPYSGTLGQIGNCQVGVFLAYPSLLGAALADVRLARPERWCADRARCPAAGAPADVTFQTKTEWGLAMLRQVRQWRALGGRWVTADEQYGQVPTFRDALDAEGWHYVLEAPVSTPVCTTAAATAVPAWSGRGRKPINRRLVTGAPAAQPVVAVLAAVLAAAPIGDWQPLTVAEGAQGPRPDQFLAQRVWESRDGLPGRECWLVLRRNRDGRAPNAYLSNAPAATPVRELAEVGARRWAIETAFQQAKGEAGLDEYEVRSGVGWRHHITLVLLAAAVLLTIQQVWGGKADPGDRALGGAGAARDPATAALDPRRVVGLADHHPPSQRPRHTVPSSPSPFPHP